MNTGELIRCFIALEIPAEVQAVLGNIIGKLKKAGADVKWVDPANIHLTLKFFGELPEAHVRNIGLALKSLKGKVRGIDSRLGGLGAFPSGGNPRVIWAGLSRGERGIEEIYHQVVNLSDRALIERDDKPFSPHLTLGRVRTDRRIHDLREMLATTELPSIDFRISRLTLIRSILTRQGAIYDPLESVGWE